MRKHINQKNLMLWILLLISVAVRLTYTYPPDFDSYWLHGMSESINIYGYANWVYHPASLFGYYPLSYPSGLMFFLSFFSAITGLSMHMTIMLTGIFSGAFATFLVFLVGRRIGGFNVGFLSALVFTLSPTVTYYSTNVASGRFFLVVFYLVFLLALMETLNLLGLGFSIKDSEKGVKKRYSMVRSLKYIASSLILLFFMFMIHRTSQLASVFIVAGILSFLLGFSDRILNYLSEHKLVKKVFLGRYEKSGLYILLDLAIFLFIIASLKFIDLMIRGRFWINVQRRLMPYYDKILGFYQTQKELLLGIGLVGFLLFVIVAAIFIVKRKRIIRRSVRRVNNIYLYLKKDLNRTIYILLFISAAMFFILQFFGKSFYSPSLEQFFETQVIQGSGPIILFLNFLINSLTSISILSPFALIGVLYIFFKRYKEPSDDFLIFVLIAFSGLLLDKNYVRLFIMPIFSLVIGIGIVTFLDKIGSMGWKNLGRAAVLLMIISASVFAFTPQARDMLFETRSATPYRYNYVATGQYIGSLDCNCSTVTTREQVAGVVIFAESGVPGGSHNIYYYVNKSYLKPDQLNWTKIKDDLTRGEKVTTLWYLPDWIFGGQYYTGRHSLILFGKDYFDRTAQRMMEDYNEKYFIHDKSQDMPDFYRSVSGHMNKVYDNPLNDVHDLEKGMIDR